MKLGWQVGIAVVAVGLGLYLSRKPWEVYRDQKSKAEASTVEMQKAERDRVEMMEQKARVGSALGREEAIRKKGWLKPGETVAGN